VGRYDKKTGTLPETRGGVEGKGGGRVRGGRTLKPKNNAMEKEKYKR